MSEQVGLRGLLRHLREEAPLWAATLPQIPRLVHRVLAEDTRAGWRPRSIACERAQARQAKALFALVAVLALLVAARAPALAGGWRSGARGMRNIPTLTLVPAPRTLRHPRIRP